MILSVMYDGILAAIAAVGFAVISNPSRKAIYVSALLAAIGHSLRFMLVKADVEISIATFVASTSIGLLSVFFARLIRCPAEVFSFPSLLPMIPGMFAYKAIISIIKFKQTADTQKAEVFLLDFFRNGSTAIFILFALVVGVSMPILFFTKASYSVTRKY